LTEVASQLDKLSVSKNNSLYEGILNEESDDDEFLGRIGIGSLNNEEIDQYLNNIKEKIETVGEISC